MSLETIVVAVNNIDMLTNIRDLPRSFTCKENKLRFVVHTDPKFRVVDNGVITNFDFLVNGTTMEESESVVSLPWYPYLPVQQQVTSLRSSKWELQMFLASSKLATTSKSFKIIPTYYVPLQEGCRVQGNELSRDKTYVLKTKYGARGMGQFMFTPKDVSLEQILIAVNQSKDHKEFEKKFSNIAGSDRVSYSKGLEFSEGESFSILKGQDFVIQELVPNIVKEFRLIARHDGEGVNWLCHERILVDRESQSGLKFTQASIDGASPLTELQVSRSNLGLGEVLLSKGISESFDSLIKDLLNKYGFLLSIDLFLTDENELGVLEVSNQFSVVDFGEKFCNEFTKDALVEAVKNKIKENQLLIGNGE